MPVVAVRNRDVNESEAFHVFREMMELAYPLLSGTFNPYSNEVYLMWENVILPGRNIYVPFKRGKVQIYIAKRMD